MIVYLTKPSLLPDLLEELGETTEIHGNLVFSPALKPVCFALDIWFNPEIITFQSISEAAKILRSKGKFWYLNPVENIRRSQLILSELRKPPVINFHFPMIHPLPEIGVFSLLDKNTLVYATKRLKKIPNGEYFFIEDKKNPPNRAYLKLWEALSLCHELPEKNALAIDLGASPGGWSYVMHSLGARVIAVDKAELDANIAKLPRIKFLKQSAFALEPDYFSEPIDWLLCDVACYPDRLYTLIEKWLSSKKAKRMIFTIKLQGETDLNVIRKFQAIKNVTVIHLFHNKHEATFFYPAIF